MENWHYFCLGMMASVFPWGWMARGLERRRGMRAIHSLQKAHLEELARGCVVCAARSMPPDEDSTGFTASPPSAPEAKP